MRKSHSWRQTGIKGTQSDRESGDNEQAVREINSKNSQNLRRVKKWLNKDNDSQGEDWKSDKNDLDRGQRCGDTQSET